MKTVLITGASSGLGKKTAEYFYTKGWNVAATMRTPEKETELTRLKNVKCLRLDVTDLNSIKEAFKEAQKYFGDIDVVINNAGFASFGPFESASPDEIQAQYDTNLFGVMNVIREALPIFRKKKRE